MMIGSVSSVNFGNTQKVDLARRGAHDKGTQTSTRQEEYVEGKSKLGRNLAITAGVIVAALAGLGIAVKKGKLNVPESEVKGFTNTIKKYAYQTGKKVSELWDNMIARFSKTAKAAGEDAAKIVDEAGEVAEGAAKT